MGVQPNELRSQGFWLGIDVGVRLAANDLLARSSLKP